jgi:hypothetical protein
MLPALDAIAHAFGVSARGENDGPEHISGVT